MQSAYFDHHRRQLAVLIDPDKQTENSLLRLIDLAVDLQVDYFFVGGSLLSTTVDGVVQRCKQHSTIPVVLFPGNANQLCHSADALLFLSLLSGRNPEYLIGQHVSAAPFLYQSSLRVLPTAYLLVDGGVTSSVEYISNTRPIPAAKTDIAVATALAAYYLGMHYIYLEAGSGALHPVPYPMVQAVKEATGLPLIVGGGIRSAHVAHAMFAAGANVVVVGTALEHNPELLRQIAHARH